MRYFKDKRGVRWSMRRAVGVQGLKCAVLSIWLLFKVMRWVE